MQGSRQKLVSMIDEVDPFGHPDQEIRALQIMAADEYLQAFRGRIALLGRMAETANLERIESLQDIVAVLFSHTAYKSYPQSFVTNGQWDRLLKWFSTLVPTDVSGVDLSNVTGIDGFIDRLWDSGHQLYSSSGTSGKCSLVNNAPGDRDVFRRFGTRFWGWPRPITAPRSYRYIAFRSSRGRHFKLVDAAQIRAEVFAEPGEVHFLSEEPMLVSDASRMAQMRLALIDGTATPQQIASFEAEATARAERMGEATERLIALVLASRDRPIIVAASWAQHWAIMERARDRGIPDGTFHPDSLVATGGGLKGVALPPDYQEQIRRFYGRTHIALSYGMSEESTEFPRCEAGRYHRPPWIVMLVLDQLGERVLNQPGTQVEGRFGFLDLTFEGRWGGLITGDKVVADFSDTCPCGRPGPTILDPITRYSEAQGGDDKIGCSASIDAYLRGMVGA